MFWPSGDGVQEGSYGTVITIFGGGFMFHGVLGPALRNRPHLVSSCARIETPIYIRKLLGKSWFDFFCRFQQQQQQQGLYVAMKVENADSAAVVDILEPTMAGYRLKKGRVRLRIPIFNRNGYYMVFWIPLRSLLTYRCFSSTGARFP